MGRPCWRWPETSITWHQWDVDECASGCPNLCYADVCGAPNNIILQELRKNMKNIMQCCWISGGKPCGLDCNMTECDKDYMFVVIACINIKCNVWQFNHWANYAWTAWGECHSCRDWQGLYQLVVSNRDLCLQECDHHFECLH